MCPVLCSHTVAVTAILDSTDRSHSWRQDPSPGRSMLGHCQISLQGSEKLQPAQQSLLSRYSSQKHRQSKPVMSTIKTRGQMFCQNAKLVRFGVSIMQTKHIGMTASKRSKDLLFLQSGGKSLNYIPDGIKNFRWCGECKFKLTNQLLFC